MAKCCNCGLKKGTLEICPGCDKHICSKCGQKIFNFLQFYYGNTLTNRPGIQIKNVTICPSCFGGFERDIIQKTRNYYFSGKRLLDNCVFCGPDHKLDFIVHICPTTFIHPYCNDITGVSNVTRVDLLCPTCRRTYYGNNYIFSREEISQWVIPYTGPYTAIYYHISMAHIAEKAGRYGDAADHYELVGLVSNAKELRDSNRTIRHINIDVNRMLEMFSKTNYTIPYKCPGCGAVIKLNKERGADKFLTCEYCNSSLKAVDIEALINQFL